MKALIRIAQIVDAPTLLRHDTIREGRELFSSLKLARPEGVEVFVDHDRSKPIGRVLELLEFDDTEGTSTGRYAFARCELDERPDWLRKGTPASMSWANAGTRQAMPSGWDLYRRALVSEVSLLSPGVEPAEKAARVVLLQDSPAAGRSSSSRSDAAGEIHVPRVKVRRRYPTTYTVGSHGVEPTSSRSVVPVGEPFENLGLGVVRLVRTGEVIRL